MAEEQAISAQVEQPEAEQPAKKKLNIPKPKKSDFFAGIIVGLVCVVLILSIFIANAIFIP